VAAMAAYILMTAWSTQLTNPRPTHSFVGFPKDLKPTPYTYLPILSRRDLYNKERDTTQYKI